MSKSKSTRNIELALEELKNGKTRCSVKLTGISERESVFWLEMAKQHIIQDTEA